MNPIDVIESLGPVLALAAVALVAKALLTARRSGGRSKRAKGDGLAALDAVGMDAKDLMSGQQASLLPILDAFAGRQGLRVHAEVGLAAIVAPTKGDRQARLAAFNAISQKRVDFLLTDANRRPVLVVEFQGSGHWANGAAKRDAVKAAALSKAGIPLVQVFPAWEDRALLRKLHAHLHPGLRAA